MMQSVLRAVLRRSMRVFFRGAVSLDLPQPLQRLWIRAVSSGTLVAKGTKIAPAIGAPVPSTWLRSGAADDRPVLLYFHGGGYTLGSEQTHRSITSHIAREARAAVLAPNYRLAPEHPYPAPLEDALAVYRWLLEAHGPRDVVVGGDSAGGGLALLMALALKDAGLPAPAGLVLLSPWTDLTMQGESHVRLRDIDPLLSRDWLDIAEKAFRGAIPADDPRVSPLFADLRGLPRMLIQCGSDEILLSDCERLAEKTRAAGVDVQLQVEQGMWHDFQLHAGVLRESDAAIGRIGVFVEECWRAASAAPGLQKTA